MDEYEEEQTTNGFPDGLRVLAVDDDSVVLRTLELQLLKCGYKVTVTHHALDALKLLRMNKDQYDLVISDVNMPDMDGFKLLDIVGLEMDLPVIMLSVECDFKNVMKGVMHGAVDYIVKPVRLQELKLIWKHVARRSFKEKKDSNDTSSKLESAAKSKYVHKSKQTKNCKDHKRVSEKDDSADSDENMAAQKKPRVAWTPDLHTKFINVVQELGISRAVPKKILDTMNIPGLTRENVASHLQKYRKGLKKIEMDLNQQLFNHVGSSACSGNSLPMIANQERIAMCSFDRTREKYHRNMPMTSSYFPAQQSFQVSSTCFSHSLSLQNNFCRPYAMNLQTRELRTQHPCCTTNSHMKKASSQVLSYHSFDPQSNQRDGYAESSQNFGLNSVYQLGHASDNQTADMFLSNNLLDNYYSTDLDASLALEQEQNRFNSFTEEDVNTSNRDYYMESCPNFSVRTFSFDKVKHTDDLHAAFQQFQR